MTRPAKSGLTAIQATLGNSEGQLGSFVPHGRIFIPGGPVTLESGSRLRWEIHWYKATHKTPTRAMFDSFIRLWDESDEKIREFAERWGPLSIDGKGEVLDVANLERRGPDVSVGFDFLEVWKYFSRRAYSVLKIATALKRGGSGDEADWDVIASPQPAGPMFPLTACVVSPFGMPNHARREQII